MGMITKRFELLTDAGKVVFGRTMSYTDEVRLADALSWFFELAEAHNVGNINDLKVVIYKA